MPRRAILFVDLLGVQRMWQNGGAAAVKARIDSFHGFIKHQLTYLPETLHREGDYTVILSGDSVAVTCEDYEQAIGIGIHLFRQAFYAKIESPYWLRGAISRWSNQYFTGNTTPISTKGGLQVGVQYAMEEDYLHVLALEKSGFKGMRLLINSALLPNFGRDLVRVWPGCTRPLRIIAHLAECTYPDAEYADVLWMADDEHRYDTLTHIMAQRFKRSTHDQEEFTQAAWTRATFDQVESILWVCGYRRLEAPGVTAGVSPTVTSEVTVIDEEAVTLVGASLPSLNVPLSGTMQSLMTSSLRGDNTAPEILESDGTDSSSAGEEESDQETVL
jgi:hypothetical protein